jgi:hypothetical protein
MVDTDTMELDPAEAERERLFDKLTQTRCNP